MRLGADAADAVGQVGHVLRLPADAELLEAAQLGDLEIGVGDLALVIEEDVDLAVTFQAGNGVDRDALHLGPPHRVEADEGNRRPLPPYPPLRPPAIPNLGTRRAKRGEEV